MNAPLGLDWGTSRSSVRNRFAGIAPAADAEHALCYPTSSVAERIWAQGGFCPAALLAGTERTGDEVVFDFNNDQLQAIVLRFGYTFDTIGQDPDTLSEQAMSTHASAQFHKLVLEFSTRYGAPSYLSERPGRAGVLHAHGTALFGRAENTIAQLVFGHDGGSSLLGEIRYRPYAPERVGF